MDKQDRARLEAKGYEVQPSRSQPGRYRWWIKNSNDGSLPQYSRDCSEETFASEQEAWADIARIETVPTRFFTAQTISKVGQLMMQDIVGDYDRPDAVPEWQWVQAKACFSHRLNGEPGGVWEFLVHIGKDLKNIPEKLAPAIEEARSKGITYVMFHQGS